MQSKSILHRNISVYYKYYFFLLILYIFDYKFWGENFSQSPVGVEEFLFASLSLKETSLNKNYNDLRFARKR